jgi:hypothetical protein
MVTKTNHWRSINPSSGDTATIPGISKGSFAMPDMHSGYGFTIGSVAVIDFQIRMPQFFPVALVTTSTAGFALSRRA